MKSTMVVIAAGILAYSLISGRLKGTIFTAPLVFVAFGLLVGSAGLGVAHIDPGHGTIHLIAELTLILVLFNDAARIDVSRLKFDHTIPVRMLMLGLPLIIAFGALVALALFPHFTLVEAALLAALLAPTDAALGQAVVAAKIVPVRIRQALNVESGLNDGIVLPIVLLLASLATHSQEAKPLTEWLTFAATQVTLGPIVGIVFGYAGARALDTAATNGWADPPFQGIGVLALALLTYAFAESIGGNGFIAAFTGGMVFGNTVRHPCGFLYEFMETEGELLMLLTFTIFATALIPEALPHINTLTFVYAILSLTVIRMLPVAISLRGLDLRLPTHLFLGWFGPRGLASVLFVLLILENAEAPHQADILATTVVTVALSVLLHGVSAAPLAAAYGAVAARLGECEENRSVSEHPLRHGATHDTP